MSERTILDYDAVTLLATERLIAFNNFCQSRFWVESPHFLVEPVFVKSDCELGSLEWILSFCKSGCMSRFSA